MNFFQAMGDMLSGTTLREWSIDLASDRKLKFILKERKARRYVLMRISSSGDYTYEPMELSDVEALAELLSEMVPEITKK